MSGGESASESTLLTAGHGFYQFAMSRLAFDRSLYYNLLLQPSIAIPDHYLLHGEWLGEHLDRHPTRDSWIETGVRHQFITPFLRQDSKKLSEILRFMQGADRRGFSTRAHDIAERLDRTAGRAAWWSSRANSALFMATAKTYLLTPEPPMLQLTVDPDDFAGFWMRSRPWIRRELEVATERSSSLLGSEGLLLSQLIQVSGERLLGRNCGRIADIRDLLARARTALGVQPERDLRVYYTALCEAYNRSLADTLLVTTNSARWAPHVAAFDLWREEVLNGPPGPTDAPHDEALEVAIRLPHPRHLRSVSGDILLTIRETPASHRYFEALANWRLKPHDEALRGELVESVARYSQVIMKSVGREVGALGLSAGFLTKASDISGVLDNAPGVVQGYLAVGAAGATATATGKDALLVPSGLMTLFLLRLAAKHYMPSSATRVSIASRQGVRLHADVTITRAG